MIEVLSAKKYYGKHSVGTVLLVDGSPWHFTGSNSRNEAEKAAARINARRTRLRNK